MAFSLELLAKVMLRGYVDTFAIEFLLYESDKCVDMQRLATLLSRLQSQATSGPSTHVRDSDKLDSLIILDRRVDMITPLLTQLTYEGLIDELIGMKNCMCCTCGSDFILRSPGFDRSC